MNEIILKTGSPSKRVRLSREELLAGKCFPDDNASFDPRLRSPDDVLSERMQRSSQSAPSAAQTSIAALQRRYETEIKAWREYENQVQEWKKDVTELLEQFKNAANEKEVVVQALQKAQQKIQQQEQELAWFRQQLTVPSSSTF